MVRPLSLVWEGWAVGPRSVGHALPGEQDTQARRGARGLLYLWNRSLLCCRARGRIVPSYGEVLLSWCSLRHCCLLLPQPLLSPRKQGWTGPQQHLFESQVPMGDTFPKPWHGLVCAVVTNTVTWQYRAAHPWLMSHVAMGHFHRGECKSRSPAGALPCSWSAQRHSWRGFTSAEHPTYRSNQYPKYWQPPRKATVRATLQSVKALKKKGFCVQYLWKRNRATSI